MNPMTGYAPMNRMLPNAGATPNPLHQQIAQAMMGGAPQMGMQPQGAGMRPQMPPRGMLR